jgi:hypothetical protein
MIPDRRAAMTRLEFSIEVPDQLANDARKAGLLEPDALAEMLREGVRRRALERIKTALNKAGPGKPMSLSEFQEIVNSLRKRGAGGVLTSRGLRFDACPSYG